MSASIQELVEAQDWVGVRRSIESISSLETITSILGVLVRDRHDVPEDIISSLLVSLRKHRPDQGTVFRRSSNFEHTIWISVLCLSRPPRGDWYSVCRRASTGTLKAILNEYQYYITKGCVGGQVRTWSSNGSTGDNSTDTTMAECLDVRKIVTHLVESFLAPDHVFPPNTNSAVQADEDRDARISGIKTIEDLESDGELFSIWQRIEVLVGFAKKKETPLPHFLVRQGYPSILVWLVGKISPDLLKKRDELGCLPLHYAAQPLPRRNGTCREECRVISSSEKLIGKSTLRDLMDAFPSGARYQDGKGRIPLTLLVQAGASLAHVMAMVKLAPQALLARDRRTHLYPFMLAATVNYIPFARVSYCTFACGRDGIGDLDTIYALLRENPSAVAYGSRHSNVETYYERYLKQKLSAAKEEIVALREENGKLLARAERVEKTRKRTSAEC